MPLIPTGINPPPGRSWGGPGSAARFSRPPRSGSARPVPREGRNFIPRNILISLALAALMLAWAGPARAGEAWVGGLQITVRTGPGLDYRIVAFLDAGEAVEVVEAQEGWSRITWGEDRTGWALSRFLSPGLSPEAKARRLTEANDRLRAEVEKLTARSETAPRPAEAAGNVDSAGAILPRTDPAELGRATETAQGLIAGLNRELDRLRIEAEGHGGTITWFLLGAGLAAMGMLLGFASSRIKFSRGSKNRYLQ